MTGKYNLTTKLQEKLAPRAVETPKKVEAPKPSAKQINKTKEEKK